MCFSFRGFRPLLKGLFFATLSLALLLEGCGPSKKKAETVVSTRPAMATEKVEAALKTALAFYDAKKFDSVVETLKDVVAAGKAPEQVYHLLGMSYLNLARFPQAERIFAAGLAEHLYSATIRRDISSLNYVRGRLLLEEERVDRARGYFEKAIVNSPRDRELAENIANLYAAHGRKTVGAGAWAKAARLLGDAVTFDHVAEGVHVMLARSLVELDQIRKAEKVLADYLVERGDDGAAWAQLASIYTRLGRNDKADDAMARARQADPNQRLGGVRIDSDVPQVEEDDFVRGRRLLKEGQFARAYDSLMKSLDGAGAGERFAVYKSLAEAAAGTKNFGAALDFCDKALADRPGDVDVQLLKARFFTFQRQLGMARQIYERLLAQESGNHKVRLKLAEFFILSNLPASAIPHLELITSKEDAAPELKAAAYDALGICHARAKHYEKAEACWEQLLLLDEGNAKALYNIAVMNLHRLNYSKAIRFFERATQAVSSDDGQYGKFLWWLSMAYFQAGQNRPGVETLEKMLQILSPADPYFQKAKRQLARWSKRVPDDPRKSDPSGGEAKDGPVDMAFQLFGEGKFEDARAAFEALLAQNLPEGDERLHRCIYGLGMVHFSEGNFPRAVVLLQKALDSKPDHAETAIRLGQAFVAMQLWGEALAALGSAKVPEDEHAKVDLDEARCLRALGRIDEAMVLYEKLVDADPDSLIADEARKALNQMEQSMKGDPLGLASHPTSGADSKLAVEAYLSLARAFADEGQDEQARGYLRKILAVDGSNVEALLTLGGLLEKDEHCTEAVELFQKVLELAPNDERAHLRLGWIAYTRLNRVSESIEHFEAALSSNPRNSNAAFYLAEIYRKIGELEKGRAILERLVQMGISEKVSEQARQLLNTFGQAQP